MRILIVEDEETMVTSLRALLVREGYEVVAARDGPDGVDAAKTSRPDLILLDLALPGLDGLEVCRRVRVFSTAPIIMLTARAGEGDKVTGLDVGADDYVTKPFRPGSSSPASRPTCAASRPTRRQASRMSSRSARLP